MEKRLQEVLEKRFHKTLDTCTKEELFHALYMSSTVKWKMR